MENAEESTAGQTLPVKVSDLIPDPHNANKGTDRGNEMIQDSLREYGAGRSIVVDRNNVIVAGNKTAQNALAVGIEDAVVVESDGSKLIVVKRTDLDLGKDPKAKMLALVDNRSQEVSLTWDSEVISIMLQDPELKVTEIFSWDELKTLGVSSDLLPQAADPDEAPPVPVTPKTRKGDIYELGAHRLMCGDATILADVLKLMDGNQADCVWTDPPYNVAYVGATKDKLTIQNDNMDSDQFRTFLRMAFENMYAVTAPGRSIYIAHADTEGYNFRGAMVDAGWSLRQCLIWAKNAFVLGRQDYHWKHEPILYGWKPGAAHSWHSDRTQTTLLEFDRPSRSAEHPTMKPVALIEYCLRNSSLAGQSVIDLFAGSGSTLLACENSARRCYGMEMDPVYCDVIVARWEQFTGQVAVRIHAEAAVESPASQ